jgi:hypothetical protein
LAGKDNDAAQRFKDAKTGLSEAVKKQRRRLIIGVFVFMSY